MEQTAAIFDDITTGTKPGNRIGFVDDTICTSHHIGDVRFAELLERRFDRGRVLAIDRQGLSGSNNDRTSARGIENEIVTLGYAIENR